MWIQVAIAREKGNKRSQERQKITLIKKNN
jgi:predicted GIY-YIG superfamily endonuclease